MNKQLSDYAKTELKYGLSQCTEEQRDLFKRMYSHTDLTKHINDVVDSMPDEKLDWAMHQIQNTLKKKIKTLTIDLLSK